jgi:hypothetical protein
MLPEYFLFNLLGTGLSIRFWRSFHLRTGKPFELIPALEYWDFKVELEYNASSNIREYVDSVLAKHEHEYPSSEMVSHN